MNINELKIKIENKNVTEDLIIFLYPYDTFLCNQYIAEISKIKNLDIEYIDSLISDNSLFSIKSNSLRVYTCDSLNELSESVKKEKNLIVKTKKISKEVQSRFEDYICTIPKLEEWQIKDYTYSKLESIDRNKLDNLIAICKNNIYRIDSEISKLDIFSDVEKPYVFDDFVSDNVFSDLSKYNVFDITNALLTKDIQKLKSSYVEMQNIDVDPIGFCTILTNSFREVLMLTADPRITPEEMGISKGKFFAVKNNNLRYYTFQSLIKIFEFLLDIDRKVKLGELPVPILIDYIITHILEN